MSAAVFCPALSVSDLNDQQVIRQQGSVYNPTGLYRKSLFYTAGNCKSGYMLVGFRCRQIV